MPFAIMPRSHILFLYWLSISAGAVKKKLSVQSSHRPHGSLFIRWMPKVSNLWSWAKPKVFTHTGLETSVPSQGHPQEWRACYQGRAWGALISTSVGCWLIGLIGNLSCEVQCQPGRVRPGGVLSALAAVVVSSAARSFPSPRQGQGPAAILGRCEGLARLVGARTWRAGPATRVVTWRGRRRRGSCRLSWFWEEKGTKQLPRPVWGPVLCNSP